MKLIEVVGEKLINVPAGENFNIYLEDFSQENLTLNLTIKLEGEHSSCNLQGRIFADKKNRKNWKIKQIITARNQEVVMNIKGIANDDSYLQIDGQVVVEPMGADAKVLVDEQIILFDNGQANITPTLDINLDNVSSIKHSASISPIDEQLVLLLESRGINKEDSLKMIKDGFLFDKKNIELAR